MENKVLSSFQEMDKTGVALPLVTIYRKTKDFPRKCVARLFDGKTGMPTPQCIIRKTVTECREDIWKSGFRVVFGRSLADDSAIVESWV